MISASIGPYRVFALLAMALGFSTVSFGQTNLTVDNFETAMLNYKPVKKTGLSEKSFNYGSMIISEMQSDVSNDAEGFNRADYFNVLSAFLTLEESDENILLAYEKFSQSQGACEYFTSFESKVRENEKYALLRENWLRKAAACKKGEKLKLAPVLSDYSNEYEVDLDLVKLMQEIDNRDQRYRSGNTDKSAEQKKADLKNQVLIDSLFNAHNTYLGESLVGPKFSSVMWAVIQHSNPEMMKKYLPVLKRAVAENELALAPLKMTIDRYYALTYGYQIFGSQGGDLGVKLADKTTKARVMEEYGIK